MGVSRAVIYGRVNLFLGFCIIGDAQARLYLPALDFIRSGERCLLNAKTR